MEFFRESSTDNYDEENVDADFQTFSKEFIDHFLVDSIYQFPIGDSFRKLNLNLYQKIFSAEPKVVLGTYHNDQFSSTRFENQYSQMVHATLVSGYNSHIHKQDDDLSFCLAIDGKIIIDDAGYTDTATAEQYAFLASTSAHSMLTLPGLEFKENQGKDASSVNPVTENDGTYRLSGIHHRIPNTVVEREVLATSKGISINDNVMSSEQLESQVVKRRFVINPEFNFEILDTRGVSITDADGKEILFIRSNNATFTSVSEGVYVGQDKRHTEILKGFDVFASIENYGTIHVEFRK